jgi:hypothetical protein
MTSQSGLDPQYRLEWGVKNVFYFNANLHHFDGLFMSVQELGLLFRQENSEG